MKKTLPLVFARRLALVALPLLLTACIVDPGPRYESDQGYVSGGGYYDDGYGYDDGYYGPRSYPPGYGPDYYGRSYYYSDPYYGRVYYGPTWYGPGYYYGAGGTIVYYRDVETHKHYYRGRPDDWSRAHQRNERNQNQRDDRWQQAPRGSSGSYRDDRDRRGDDYDRPRSSRPPAQQSPRNGGLVDDAARKLVKPQPAPRSSPTPQREVPAPAPRAERPAKDKSAGQLWKDRNQHGD